MTLNRMTRKEFRPGVVFKILSYDSHESLRAINKFYLNEAMVVQNISSDIPKWEGYVTELNRKEFVLTKLCLGQKSNTRIPFNSLEII